ncbi:cytochrome P450 71A1 [Selaginella moellendorffii]|nr:cytochrome P450 71A1 [Selaginella moellendorffii]|eukprot:XP_002979994.2 cytochrome P450 71A1 [Selaginella moellendorffii]
MSFITCIQCDGLKRENKGFMEFPVYFLVALVVCFLGRSLLQSRKRLPPSPWGLPLIGHVHHLSALPHQSLQNLSRKLGGIMYLRLGMTPVIVISSPDLAKEALRSNDSSFGFRPYLLVGEYLTYNFKGIGLSNGDHWKNMRKICITELFSVKRLESFRGLRLAEVSHLVSRLAQASKSQSVVNVRELLTDFNVNIVSQMLMSKRFFENKNLGGEEVEEVRQLREFLEELTRFALKFHISEFVPAWLRWIDWNIPHARKLVAKQEKFFEKIIQEHKSSQKSRPVMDFMDILLQHQEDEEAAKATFMELLAAGTDTSACTTEWALLELLNNPEIMRKAQEELDTVVGRDRMVTESDLHKLLYLEDIVKETFRFHPPGPLLPRMSTQACVLGESFDIPKGATTIINFYAIGRDPRVWDKPEKFWPERFQGSTIDVKGQDFELIPFGSGRRSCPGMLLGLKSVYLTLANLIHGFNWEPVARGGSYNMDEAFMSVIWPKLALQAKVTSM